MDLKNLVASYATKKDGKTHVNLEALAHDAGFRSEVIQEVLNDIKKKPHLCVYFPSFKPTCNRDAMGKLINELALNLQVETLVTGNIEKLGNLHNPVQDIIIVKQSFRTGKELHGQIEKLKEKGYNVSVLCLIAHSRGRLEGFAYENQVEIEALVYTDDPITGLM